MKSSYYFNEEEELWKLVKRINRSWLQNKTEKLKDLLHEKIVLLQPDMKHKVEGREQLTRGYKDFVEKTKINSFEEKNPTVSVFKNTAICSYIFEIDYELDSNRFFDTGEEIFIFENENNKWLAIWRHLIIQSQTKK